MKSPKLSPNISELGRPSISGVSLAVRKWKCETAELVLAMNRAFAPFIARRLEVPDDATLEEGLVAVRHALNDSIDGATRTLEITIDLSTDPGKDDRNAKLPLLLICAAIRSVCRAALDAVLALEVPPDQPRFRKRVHPVFDPDDVSTVEIHYAIGARPFRIDDPFTNVLNRRISALINEHLGMTMHVSSREWGVQAQADMEDFLSSTDAAAGLIRSSLAIERVDETSLEVIGTLKGIETVLTGWIDPVKERIAQRSNAWNEYKESLIRLPDSSETMFNESFGVRLVFQPPIMTYRVNSRQTNRDLPPERIEEIGRLVGGLLSNRTSGEDLIILSGGPGSGKSTLCRVLASKLAAIDEIYPVFLRLRKVREGVDITTFVEDSLRNLALIDRISDLREVPNLILILDGFDELAMSSRARLRQLFNTLRDELSTGPLRRAKVIVSGRDTLFPMGEGLPLGSHVLHLEPFDKPRVMAWGAQWRVIHEDGPGGSFMPELVIPTDWTPSDDDPLVHLLVWPLTLHLLAQIHTAGRLQIGVRPAQDIERAYLYRAILAETSARQVEQVGQEKEKGRLDPKKMREFLRELAWQMYLRSVDSIDTADVSPLLLKFFPDARESELSDLAEVAVVNSPELNKGEETGFEFVHKSFSEFLVAEGVAIQIEHVIFKSESYGSADRTWRMTEEDAASTLAPTIASRLLTAEVLEMLEPMLGVMGSFARGTRVDNDVPDDVRNEGLNRVIDRFERLYVLAIAGEPFNTVYSRAREGFLTPCPLETYANYCLGILLVGSAAARRLVPGDDRESVSRRFACDPYPGAFWRYLAIAQLGGIQMSEALAYRLFRGASVVGDDGVRLGDVDFPVNFEHLRFLDGFDRVIATSARRASAEVSALWICVLMLVVGIRARPDHAVHGAQGDLDEVSADFPRSRFDFIFDRAFRSGGRSAQELLSHLNRIGLVDVPTLHAVDEALDSVRMTAHRGLWDRQDRHEFAWLLRRNRSMYGDALDDPFVEAVFRLVSRVAEVPDMLDRFR